MRGIIDTSVLVAGQLPLEGDWLLSVPSLAYAELEAAAKIPGLDALDRSRREARLEIARRRFGDGLPFDDAAAASYGIIAGYVMSQGRQLRGRVVDLMVAAVAHANRATLITLDAKDLAMLEPITPVIVLASGRGQDWPGPGVNV
jgi:predicted nucleic acid-binding protein